MNIFKWITGRTGKASLLQMVGLGAVGVAGAAAVGSFLLSGSPADNTAFSPAQYNPGEVVYVAGANTGSYGSGAYSMDGLPESSLQVSANTIKRIERQTMAEKAAEEMAGEALPDDQVVPTDPKAYQMGAAEGLGMAGNATREEDLKKNPMGALGGMPDISGMIAQATQAAQGGSAKEAKPQAGGQTAAALASAQKNWSGGASGGHAFNSSFSVQDSGKNGGAPGAAAPGGAADAVAAAKAQMSRTMEGARMRANAAVFGSGDDKLAQSRESTLGNYRSSKEGKDLEYIRKRSADAASNKNRAANEGSRGFLASTRISGGMRITRANVSTGQGQGSADFNNSAETSLRRIRFWGQGQEDFNYQRKKDRDDLRILMWIALPVALAAIPWIMFFAALARAVPVAWWFWVIAAGLTAVALVPCLMLLSKSAIYAQKYGGSGLSTWGMTLSSILSVGVGLSWIPGAINLIGNWNIWLTLAGTIGAGLGGAWLVNSMTEDPVMDDPDYSNPLNKE